MPLPILPNNSLIQPVRRRLESAVAVDISPFTGTEYVQDWGGRWWVYDLTFGVKKDAAGRALEAFFTALEGRTNSFIFRDPTFQGSAPAGTPLVSGSGQTGNTLNTKGWNANTSVLRAGDFISLGTDSSTHLYQVTVDATSDGSGLASLSIVPALRTSPLDGDAVEVQNPQVHLRASSVPVTSIQFGTFYTISMTAKEVV